MLIYAVPGDLVPVWLPEVPATADRLLRHASLLVRRATRLAIYDADTAGMPTDAAVRAAFRDAVCAQATAWSLAGIDPAAGSAGLPKLVAAQSTPEGGSVTYAVAAAADRQTRDLEMLGEEAELILAAEGLVVAAPRLL
ncbi:MULTISPECIES: hypothetical protein [unclassified Nocardia]|uniref:hypothetical protein n=1 Tax=unclassified Nocardia TaxID=2637762 RepID=UPI00278C3F60|nr:MULTISPECIES: hypothetical protein [unclassified Nocardia]